MNNFIIKNYWISLKYNYIFLANETLFTSLIQKLCIFNEIFSFTENQLLYVIKDLFSAGIDTTDNTIGFVIAFLVVHQDVQAKVYDEINRVIGKDVYPSLSDKDR